MVYKKYLTKDNWMNQKDQHKYIKILERKSTKTR